MALEVLALVKHDCPVCDQLLPALDAAGARLVSQSSPEQTAAQAARLGLSRVPEIDVDLALSEHFDPGRRAGRSPARRRRRARPRRGARERMAALVAQAGATLSVDGLPAMRPGCASLTRDPEVAARLAARRARADGRIVARELSIGDLEDPFETLHERGMTDGLPVVPPTPERVVAMLEHTSRHAQDIVGEVPPYGGRATVEKVAINAVMAGCAGPELPILGSAAQTASVEPWR